MMGKKRVLTVSLNILCCLLITGVYVAPVSASSLSTTTLVTTGLGGTGSDGSAHQRTKTLSHDGRIAVYATDASNIVPNDTNRESDVFAYDRVTKKTELISANQAGNPGDGMSAGPTVSADGRYVAYTTTAKNILQRNPDMCADYWCKVIIVHDRLTGKNVFGNLDSKGAPLYVQNEFWNTISADGRSVVFNTYSERANDTNGEVDTYIHNWQTGVSYLVSVDNKGRVGENAAYGFSSNADGRYVTFETYSQLTRDDTDEGLDVYMRDTLNNKTTLISVTLDPKQRFDGCFSSVISDDGKWVVFLANDSKLVPDDTNGVRDVFVRDLQHNTTKRVSVAYNGNQANENSIEASISSDGRFIAYSSNASSLVPGDINNRQDIFLYDSTIGLTRRINRASADGRPTTTGDSQTPVISGDGRAVMFISNDPGLTSTVLDPSWANNVYITYNPVVQIPYYDAYDVDALLKSF